MGLVHSVARRYARRGGEPVDDLIQVGAIGLIKAVDRYEPSRGRDLRAIAVPAIEGEIRHHLRDRSQVVRTPRPLAELAARARRAQVKLGAKSGRLPTHAEVAAAVGASEQDVADALQAQAPAVALEPDRVAAAPEDHADERALLEAGMRVLSKRERRILELRYFEDRSQAEIARTVGLSQAQVSRLIGRAIERMRGAVVEGRADPAPREGRSQRAAPSGRLLVRMPQSLHGDLARVAEREGVSLNTLITDALAGAVGWGAGEQEREVSRDRPGLPSFALIANFVVVALVALAAMALLVVALVLA